MRIACVLALTLGASAAQGSPADEADREEGLSKKHAELLAKRARRKVHAAHPRELKARPALTVRNQWTHEVLPLDPQKPPPSSAIDGFLRDHFTNQATQMDPRLAGVILQAAAKFKATLVEVVSGYRSEKYNLMLRKKGHAVARESQHPLGHAVDFRLAGVATRQLFRFIRSLRLGGAGYYPHNGFVHADFGRVRTWVGN
jgi:uncharacterized protein YcbK (DUF882 family)